jgi:hypothetical protein
MKSTEIVKSAGFLQLHLAGLLRGDHYIPVVIGGGRSVREEVLIIPHDGVADLGRDLSRRELKVLNADVNPCPATNHSPNKATATRPDRPGIIGVTSARKQRARRVAHDPGRFSGRSAAGS